MAIFSFKSKAKKVEGKKEDVVVPPGNKPAQFRKYTPRHAATGGDAEISPDFEAMSIASQMRKPTFNRADASYASSINSRRHEAFTTHANDSFSPGAMRKLQANDPSLGYTKVALARQDQGLGQCSSDSGYESAGPSRVQSEHNLDDISRHYLPRPNGGLLPELRLGDDSLSDRSSKSATKKTRFQVEPEPEPVAVLEQSPARDMNTPAPVIVVEQPGSRNLNLSALEGFKVNKKGKVLDEEGDVLGELVEGDLLDCVRQKVNANGEVMDDVGKVVGIVKLAVSSLPALTIRPPTASPPPKSADGESSPTIAPRTPTTEVAAGTQSLQDASRRSPRSASERSLSDLSKSYARPPMSSVPENNVAEDDGIVTASPELFAYKGEIPNDPYQHTRRRSASPPLLTTHPSGRKPHVRRISSSGTSTKSFGRQPVGYASGRTPLGSYDNSPTGSDDGTETSSSDDGKLPAIVYRRPASVRSAMTVPAKPRTYFTHAGKVTVDINAPEPVQAPGFKTKPAAEATLAAPATEAVKQEKKKGKFGLRFGKK